MIRKTIILLTAGVALLGLDSCRKQLDINQNPNVARDVTPALLLPAAQVEIASALGVDFNNTGSIWVQHWTQNPSASQYAAINRYQPNSSIYDRPWQLLYSDALTDLDQTYKKASETNLKQYQAIALILKGYTYQLITDAWGDVPFTESLKGLPEDGGILNPRYDRQEIIYAGIIQMVKDGMALINEDDPNLPSTDDLIYGGDMHEWQLFANTLLLRMYMRLSERSPAMAQAGIASLYANGIGFLDEGDDAQVNYSTSSQNPLNQEVRRLGQNQIASATSGDSMNSNSDPRRNVVYNATSNVIGAPQGLTVAPQGVTYSVPGAVTGANASGLTTTVGEAAAAAPVRFLTAYESYFLQAEAEVRGWGDGTNADSLFREGIRVNFRYLGLTTAQANTYIANSYWGKLSNAGSTTAQKIRHIITQKWFSMNGLQGFEAWTEWRRTGYPNFLTPSIGNATGGVLPARFLYPDNEFSRNSNFPGQKNVTDKVWWDVN
jgi:hypothetical protein